jgi:ribA/ribD-fused uncharacterized protein
MYDYDEKVYVPNLVETFSKAKERNGAFGNMTGGLPLIVGNVRANCSESLYQSLRFTSYPNLQREILPLGGMGCKMSSKKYRKDFTRSDWDDVRVDFMEWVIRVKLACHPINFGLLLLATQGRQIVEFSKKDSFWGAKPQVDGTLKGQNVLGQILMKVRDDYRSDRANGVEIYKTVRPVDVENFSLYGNPIGVLTF